MSELLNKNIKVTMCILPDKLGKKNYWLNTQTFGHEESKILFAHSDIKFIVKIWEKFA